MIRYISYFPAESSINTQITTMFKTLPPSGMFAPRTEEMMETILASLRNVLPLTDRAVFVPLPSHTGKAELSLTLCCLLAKGTRTRVCDVLECDPHTDFGILRENGLRLPEPAELNMRLKAEVPDAPLYYLIDNLICSGTTMKAAMDTLPGRNTVGLCLVKEKSDKFVDTLKNVFF